MNNNENPSLANQHDDPKSPSSYSPGGHACLEIHFEFPAVIASTGRKSRHGHGERNGDEPDHDRSIRVVQLDIERGHAGAAAARPGDKVLLADDPW